MQFEVIHNFVVLPQGVLLLASENLGVLRSSDSGRTWISVPSGPGGSVHAFVRDGAVLFAAGEGGVYRSLDGGGTWTLPADQLARNPTRAVAVDSTGVIVAAGDSGVVQSTDHGATWSKAGAGLAGRVLSLFRDPAGQMLAGTDTAGLFVWSDSLSGVAEAETAIPVIYFVRNDPNPFSQQTRIHFRVKAGARSTLFFFDLLGRDCARRVEFPSEDREEVVMFDGQGLPSGVYLAVLKSGVSAIEHQIVLSR
jgi:hypothetical protein